MPLDPVRLLSFCQAIQESSVDGLRALDRESLLAVHKALMAPKDEIEQILGDAPLEVHSLN